MNFSKDFVFGVATSAGQVEGAALEDGRGLSIWDVFSRIPGTIIDGSKPDVACDMYHTWKDDIQSMKQMGVDSYRFSFSWSRILPDGKVGTINQKGLDYYKKLVDELHRNDIMPNATLYHWDLPYELEREGGWLNRDVVEWFGEYASLMFREFGDAIPMWSTVNEPIATYVGYANGGFAPGRRGEKFGRQANHHILLAHGEGIRRFREENIKGAKAGIVIDIWKHYPLRPEHEGDRLVAELENEKTYRSYLNPILKGCYTDALLNYMEDNQCMPVIQEGDMERISEKLDFFGLNCYNRVLDCCDPSIQQREMNPGGNYLDNGSECYPKAVYDAAKMLKEEYNLDVPIYVTENGTYNCQEEILPDGKIHDVGRIQYMKGFLEWISQAIKEGIDIRGYYAWSLFDNWEWSGGYSMRFGLIHTDFETGEKIWKDSAYWYQKLLQERKETL